MENFYLNKAIPISLCFADFVTLGTFVQFVNFCKSNFCCNRPYQRRTRVETVDWHLRESDRVDISELKDASGFSHENRRWTIDTWE